MYLEYNIGNSVSRRCVQARCINSPIFKPIQIYFLEKDYLFQENCYILHTVRKAIWGFNLVLSKWDNPPTNMKLPVP